MKKLTKMTLIALTLSIPISAQADWSILDLSSSGDSLNFPNAINDSGRIVGNSMTGFVNHAFITGPNGVGITDLTATIKIAGAFDINSSGQVAGYRNVAGGINAIITGSNAVGVTNLGTFGGSAPFAAAINDSGRVVAQFTTSTGDHTVITGPNGVGFTDIGTLGGTINNGRGINNSGQVVGTSTLSGNTQAHAYITGANGVGMTDLGFGTGRGINDSSQVIGSTAISDGTRHAYVTGANGSGMTDLGTLGGQFSDSVAINNWGEVIGTAQIAGDPNTSTHSFLFSHGGITDLNLLAPIIAAGWTNLIVRDINNNGQIVGDGVHNGVHSGFLLSYTSDTIFNPNPIFIPSIPVPEPETYVMLLAGLGLIGLMARRRKLNG